MLHVRITDNSLLGFSFIEFTHESGYIRIKIIHQIYFNKQPNMVRNLTLLNRKGIVFMNTGQTMLTLLAMMLLTLLSVRMNSSVLQTQETMQNSKFGLAAISLATSIIENANKLAFDEVTIDSSLTSTSGLTSIGQLGVDGVEHANKPPDFNDFDDYNNFVYDEKALASANYNISCSVCYVNPTTPNVAATSPTFNKKLTVSVSSVSMQDTVRISTIFSYWYFR